MFVVVLFEWQAKPTNIDQRLDGIIGLLPFKSKKLLVKTNLLAQKHSTLAEVDAEYLPIAAVNPQSYNLRQRSHPKNWAGFAKKDD